MVIVKLGLVWETLLQVSKAQAVSLSKVPENFGHIKEVHQRLTTSLKCPILSTDREQWALLFMLISTLLYLKTDMLRKNIILGDAIDDNPDNILANYVISHFSGLELLYISRYPIPLLSYPETILTAFVSRPDFNEVHALNAAQLPVEKFPSPEILGGLFAWAISFAPHYKFTKAGNLIWRILARRVLDHDDPDLIKTVLSQGYRADWATAQIRVPGFEKIENRANLAFSFLSTKYMAFSTIEVPATPGGGKRVEKLQTSSLASPIISPFSSLFSPSLLSLPRPFSSCYSISSLPSSSSLILSLSSSSPSSSASHSSSSSPSSSSSLSPTP